MSNALFLKKKYFANKYIEKRRKLFGFNNTDTFRKFLWDLEIYKQIESMAGNKICLKGGAATQFYIDKKYQRASVDIDMIFYGEEIDVINLLDNIKISFAKLDIKFEYKKHIPKNPKTTLPLLTYFCDVSFNNLIESESEVKIEFNLTDNYPKFNVVKNTGIFAFDDNISFQLILLNDLIGDKFTTIDPLYIGIKPERRKEEVKQFYDLYHLIMSNIKEFDIKEIYAYYKYRAEIEAKSRDITFNLNLICESTLNTLNEYKNIDIFNNKYLKDSINDFKSFYINKVVNFDAKDISIAAYALIWFYKCIIAEKPLSTLIDAIDISKRLDFSDLTGIEKTKTADNIKMKLIEIAENDENIDVSQFRRKHIKRVYWEIVNEKNINVVKEIAGISR